MGRRRLFRRDIGEHPPELQEFLETWHQFPAERGSGEFRRSSIGAPSSAEVRENARWFGSLLLLTAGVLPVAYWKWADGQITISGWVTLLAFSAGFAAFGVVLLRSSHVPGARAAKRPPESRSKPNQGSEQDLP